MRCELCGTATSMPEPLQQCAAWLSAYFCEPSRTQQLPLPPFHHPMLQRGQCPVPGSCRITEGWIGSTHAAHSPPQVGAGCLQQCIHGHGHLLGWDTHGSVHLCCPIQTCPDNKQVLLQSS